MTICISSYKTQRRSWEVEVEGWNILSSSPCLGNWSNILGVNWGSSPNRGCELPEIWGRSPNRKRSPRLSERGIWGEGSVSLSPENFENSYLKPCNLVYSLTFQAKIYFFPVADQGICLKWTHTTFWSQPISAVYVFENVVSSPFGSPGKPQLSTILVHFQRMHSMNDILKEIHVIGPNMNQNLELKLGFGEGVQLYGMFVHLDISIFTYWYLLTYNIYIIFLSFLV